MAGQAGCSSWWVGRAGYADRSTERPSCREKPIDWTATVTGPVDHVPLRIGWVQHHSERASRLQGAERDQRDRHRVLGLERSHTRRLDPQPHLHPRLVVDVGAGLGQLEHVGATANSGVD